MSSIIRAGGAGGGGGGPESVYSVEATVTQAQVNSGHVLIAANPGVQLVIVGYRFWFTGTWTAALGSPVINFEDTSGTVFLIYEDGVFTTNQAYSDGGDGASSLPLQAAFPFVVTAGRGVRLAADGSFTGSGTVRVRLLYRTQ